MKCEMQVVFLKILPTFKYFFFFLFLFQVGLADRSLMPGDVVRRMIKGKDTQRGYCRDIFVTACVQVVGTKQVIPDVPSEHLVPLEVSIMTFV